MRQMTLRFSIRRGIAFVAAFAIIPGDGVAAKKWPRVRSAVRDNSRSLRPYDEGRVTCQEMAFRSRCLMDAQRELSGPAGSRMAAIREHVHRLRWLRDEETRLSETYLDCRGVGHAGLEGLEGILIDATVLLYLESHAPQPPSRAS